MFTAFYPTSDFWFWILERPPWEGNHRPDSEVRAAFMQKVVWSSQQPFGEIGVCADGLFFVESPNAGDDPLAVDLDNLNTLNLLFVSVLRSQQKIDASLEWISRTTRIRGYDPATGFGGSGAFHSRHWNTLLDRYVSQFSQGTVSIRHFVEQETIEAWLQAAILVFSEPKRVRVLSEYALALSLFHDHNFAGALMHAWFVSEHIFSHMWFSLHPNGKPRTLAGAKIKGLKSHLGPALYNDLKTVKNFRNELAHAVGNADAVSHVQANLAFTVADRLVETEWGLALNLGGRGLTY